MKQIGLFNQFLADVVNLNATRVAELEKSVTSIKAAINSSDWEPEILGWKAQGSWAHQTIIRPVDFGEFDADLLVFVEPVEGWAATKYVDELYKAFCENGTYRAMVRRFSHCVTVTYANEKKIDVAPCIVNRNGFVGYEVCNRNSGEFERSEPLKYTEWMNQRNQYSGLNSFRKVTRLIKYLRDIKTTFTCSSVLLTTLLGYRISAADKYTSDFADVPSSLKTVFGRLDDWLRSNPIKPIVANPHLPTEDFAASWTQEKYDNFRAMISKYRGWIDDAYDEVDSAKSTSKWRRVFGDDFASAVVLEEAKSVRKTAYEHLKATVGTAVAFTDDVVDMVKSFGARALPGTFTSQPHMQSPTWRRLPAPLFSIGIRAHLYESKGYNLLKSDVRSLEPLQPGRWLEFNAVASNGMPPSSNDFRVEWRVTNTDTAAASKGALRGSFYPSDRSQSRSELLEYRGVHLVEAFVIRKRDETEVARSAPFLVLVE